MIKATSVLALVFAAAMCVSARAEVQLPTDIGVTMTADPSTGLQTGQIINITLSVTNYGPQPANVLVLTSSWFFHEFSVTNIDAVACYQFGGAVGEAAVHPVFLLEWFIAGVPDTPMQPFAVGETRTCHFQLVLMADAPAVTSFTFGVSGYDPDMSPANDNATVFLIRAVPQIPTLTTPLTILLAIALCTAGAAAFGRRGEKTDGGK